VEPTPLSSHSEFLELASKMSDPTAWETRLLDVAELHLDARNPRLTVDIDPTDEVALLRALVEVYDAFEVAKSISTYGFFPSEPLIAVLEEGNYVVVEGNRRLSALKLLRSGELRTAVIRDRRDEWEALATSGKIPPHVPTVIVEDRDAVAPLLGYRHISGIQEWEPWAKARFVASLVDHQHQSFDRAAASTGEEAPTVRSHYRNYHILRQAGETFGLDVRRAVDEFGVFTRAMNSAGIRDYIQAPAPREVVSGFDPLPNSAREPTAEALSWIFGDGEHQPVISDSREITTLGRVLASETARRVLRETRDLSEADEAAGGQRDRLLARLYRAARGMELAVDDAGTYREDHEVIAGVRACRAAVAKLTGVVEV
jgi:hypothetical protein